MKDIYREYIGYISSRIYEEYERDSRGCGIWVYRVERFIEEMGLLSRVVSRLLVLL